MKRKTCLSLFTLISSYAPPHCDGMTVIRAIKATRSRYVCVWVLYIFIHFDDCGSRRKEKGKIIKGLFGPFKAAFSGTPRWASAVINSQWERAKTAFLSLSFYVCVWRWRTFLSLVDPPLFRIFTSLAWVEEERAKAKRKKEELFWFTSGMQTEDHWTWCWFFCIFFLSNVWK